jgi:Thioesterase domains of type I polyketide synthases or non-ribosomal peptide synthetases
VPFEKIVEEVLPERSLSYSPLFQVMFALKNEPREALQLADTKLEPVRTGLHIAKFDLNLTVLDSQALSLFMEYNTDLFDAATITRMLGNLHELLRGICANPEQPISRLPLLTQAETAYWSPLVGIQPGGSDQPFFCVHPGGGNVLCYVELARHLGPDQPFYAFESRGLNSEQPVCTTIEEMASIYIEAMRAVRPVGPYLLGGWSMGGVVAFEMARQLEAQGEMVALLVLIDARAPGHQAEPPEEDDLAAMRSFGRHVGLPLERINISLDHFLSLGSEERLAYVIEEAKSAGLIPAAIPLSQVRRLFEVFKANAMALNNYTPEMARCRIALLKASEPVSHLLEEPAMGWAELTENGIEVTEVPGNHFTMILEPYVLFMAERLKTCIHETLVSKLNNE